MPKPDAVWAKLIADAAAAAEMLESDEVGEYISLKAANDQVRTKASEWLFATFLQIAAEAERRFGLSVSVDQKQPHSFSYSGATMAGSRLKLSRGIRCLTAEAGWTRTSADGFMRGGALAAARISHFGMPQFTTELVLKRNERSVSWQIIRNGRITGPMGAEHLVAHFEIFAGE